MRRSKGTRQGTRKILRKDPSKRGLIPINRALQEFEEGEKVKIMIEPSIQKGQPHNRFHGKIGEVEGEQGDAFVVSVKDGDKTKEVIVRPEHLEKMD
ncbi:MAG: 50S ribosomal protein L21e [Candidatus Thermoplasmatota archaeon]|nr:50S ribosomal protein L21e [Candidatus Thermoplasmatota archaeon]